VQHAVEIQKENHKRGLLSPTTTSQIAPRSAGATATLRASSCHAYPESQLSLASYCQVGCMKYGRDVSNGTTSSKRRQGRPGGRAKTSDSGVAASKMPTRWVKCSSSSSPCSEAKPHDQLKYSGLRAGQDNAASASG
jgi:hypothetical protein